MHNPVCNSIQTLKMYKHTIYVKNSNSKNGIHHVHLSSVKRFKTHQTPLQKEEKKSAKKKDKNNLFFMTLLQPLLLFNRTKVTSHRTTCYHPPLTIARIYIIKTQHISATNHLSLSTITEEPR